MGFSAGLLIDLPAVAAFPSGFPESTVTYPLWASMTVAPLRTASSLSIAMVDVREATCFANAFVSSLVGLL